MKNILVIDDDRIVRALLTKLLELSEYQVEYAENKVTAINTILHSEYDLIVMDYNLGEIKAPELLKEMEKADIIKPVIVISGTDGDELELIKDSYNVRNILRKPFAHRELIEMINSVLK